MMKVQKQTTNSSCSTPSDFRKQSWAELSEDLLTDSEPGTWESERYTESFPESPQTSLAESPIQSPAVTKDELGGPNTPGATHGDFERDMGSACYPWLQETHGAQVSCPVVDIAGLPKALCNNVCVEAMLQQAGLINEVSGFMTDETSTVRVMLANWPAAMHCMDHFKKSSWAAGSLHLTMGLAIPQAAQEMSYAQMNPQQMSYLGSPIDQFECAAY